MANQVPVCSKGYCWMCFSAVSCQCIPPTPGEAQMEGMSLLGSALTFQQAGWRGRGCCWTVGGKGLWEEPAPLCAVGTASCQQSPVWPSCDEGSLIHVGFPKPVVLRLQGSSHGSTHTQGGQGCSCGILSFIHYENWIYGSWVSLYFHMFLCGRTRFPLSCYITLG